MSARIIHKPIIHQPEIQPQKNKAGSFSVIISSVLSYCPISARIADCAFLLSSLFCEGQVVLREWFFGVNVNSRRQLWPDFVVLFLRRPVLHYGLFFGVVFLFERA